MERTFIEKLQQIERVKLYDLLCDVSIWKSVDVNYHPPHVERLCVNLGIIDYFCISFTYVNQENLSFILILGQVLFMYLKESMRWGWDLEKVLKSQRYSLPLYLKAVCIMICLTEMVGIMSDLPKVFVRVLCLLVNLGVVRCQLLTR